MIAALWSAHRLVSAPLREDHRETAPYPFQDVSLPVKLHRLGYRLAFRALQVTWFITRPRKLGVKCVLTDHGRVLLVRHTYGSRAWDLPGGGVRRRESPLRAAHREMEEELGVDGAQWRPLGEIQGSVNHRRDTIHCFEAELQAPRLTLAQAELEAAGWFERTKLPANLAPYVAPILARIRVSPDPEGS
jgi:8-oxo-dGTP pyrophosphatase MutT (NUDIX family)